MSKYITANLSFKYENENDFNTAVDKLKKSGWTIEDDNKIFFIDEDEEVINEYNEILDTKNYIIYISNVYMRNGYSLIDILSENAKINGRVISTDGNYSFVEYIDSKITEYESKDIFESFDFKFEEPKNKNPFKEGSEEFDEYNEEFEDEVFDFYDDINTIMDKWLNR